jgi:hypothetical protein
MNNPTYEIIICTISQNECIIWTSHHGKQWQCGTHASHLVAVEMMKCLMLRHSVLSSVTCSLVGLFLLATKMDWYVSSRLSRRAYLARCARSDATHTKGHRTYIYIPAGPNRLVKSKRCMLSLERQGGKGYALCSWEIQARILWTMIDQAVPFCRQKKDWNVSEMNTVCFVHVEKHWATYTDRSVTQN